MRENAKRLDQQAEILTRMALDLRRAGDANPLSRHFADEAESTRAVIRAAAGALRTMATMTERFGEIVGENQPKTG